MPKVLINPQFSFGEMSKTATEMKEHLDDICKKELSKISKTGLCRLDNTDEISLCCENFMLCLKWANLMLCHLHSQ